MGSLLRWTGALERSHVLLTASTCPDASLRERMWDMAEVPESIPLSPLLPQGNEMRSDVDSFPPPVSLSHTHCCPLSLFLCRSFSLFLKFFLPVLSVFPTAQFSWTVKCLIAALI